MQKVVKVFISHASEDKARFVEKLATELRENGIDAWLDKWEIKIGDSIVDKIFEFGIKQCKVFIIVLSKNSVNKPWVKEELNSAVVKKIENNCRIMPIIIDDDIEVPTALNHLVWKRIRDISNCNDELSEIINSILEIQEKPPLGTTKHKIIQMPTISGYSSIDTAIFKIIGDLVLENDRIDRFVEGEHFYPKIKEFQISEEEALETLEILEKGGTIKSQYAIGSKQPIYFKMTEYGFYRYCSYYLDDFERIIIDTVSKIFNENIFRYTLISEQLNVQKVVIYCIFEYFDNKGFITTVKAMGGVYDIINITGIGKRTFREMLQ